MLYEITHPRTGQVYEVEFPSDNPTPEQFKSALEAISGISVSKQSEQYLPSITETEETTVVPYRDMLDRIRANTPASMLPPEPPAIGPLPDAGLRLDEAQSTFQTEPTVRPILIKNAPDITAQPIVPPPAEPEPDAITGAAKTQAQVRMDIKKQRQQKPQQPAKPKEEFEARPQTKAKPEELGSGDQEFLKEVSEYRQAATEQRFQDLAANQLKGLDQNTPAYQQKVKELAREAMVWADGLTQSKYLTGGMTPELLASVKGRLAAATMGATKRLGTTISPVDAVALTTPDEIKDDPETFYGMNSGMIAAKNFTMGLIDFAASLPALKGAGALSKAGLTKLAAEGRALGATALVPEALAGATRTGTKAGAAAQHIIEGTGTGAIFGASGQVLDPEQEFSVADIGKSAVVFGSLGAVGALPGIGQKAVMQSISRAEQIAKTTGQTLTVGAVSAGTEYLAAKMKGGETPPPEELATAAASIMLFHAWGVRGNFTTPEAAIKYRAADQAAKAGKMDDFYARGAEAIRLEMERNQADISDVMKGKDWQAMSAEERAATTKELDHLDVKRINLETMLNFMENKGQPGKKKADQEAPEGPFEQKRTEPTAPAPKAGAEPTEQPPAKKLEAPPTREMLTAPTPEAKTPTETGEYSDPEKDRREAVIAAAPVPELRADDKVIDNILDPTIRYRNAAKRTDDEEIKGLLTEAADAFHDTIIPDTYNAGAVSRAIKEMQQRQIPFAVVMADGQNLGGVNKVYGHDGANELMAEIWGENLSKAVKDAKGVIERSKGEEFKAVFPYKTAEEIEAVMQAAAANIEAKKVEKGLTETKHPKHAGMPTGALGIDYGVSEVKPGDDVQAKIKEADKLADAMKEKKLLEIANKLNYVYSEEKNSYEPRKSRTQAGGRRAADTREVGEITGRREEPEGAGGTGGGRAPLPGKQEAGQLTWPEGTEAEAKVKLLPEEVEELSANLEARLADSGISAEEISDIKDSTIHPVKGAEAKHALFRLAEADGRRIDAQNPKQAATTFINQQLKEKREKNLVPWAQPFKQFVAVERQYRGNPMLFNPFGQEARGKELADTWKAEYEASVPKDAKAISQAKKARDDRFTHRAIVQAALDAGKDVPLSVLREYPDMTATTEAGKKKSEAIVAEANRKAKEAEQRAIAARTKTIAGVKIEVTSNPGDFRTIQKSGKKQTVQLVTENPYGKLPDTEAPDHPQLWAYTNDQAPAKNAPVVVVNQRSLMEDGGLDKHVAMIGWKSPEEALEAYTRNTAAVIKKGGKRDIRLAKGHYVFPDMASFLTWAKTGRRDLPLSERGYDPIKKPDYQPPEVVTHLISREQLNEGGYELAGNPKFIRIRAAQVPEYAAMKKLVLDWKTYQGDPNKLNEAIKAARAITFRIDDQAVRKARRELENYGMQKMGMRPGRYIISYGADMHTGQDIFEAGARIYEKELAEFNLNDSVLDLMRSTDPATLEPYMSMKAYFGEEWATKGKARIKQFFRMTDNDILEKDGRILGPNGYRKPAIDTDLPGVLSEAITGTTERAFDMEEQETEYQEPQSHGEAILTAINWYQDGKHRTKPQLWKSVEEQARKSLKDEQEYINYMTAVQEEQGNLAANEPQEARNANEDTMQEAVSEDLTPGKNVDLDTPEEIDTQTPAEQKEKDAQIQNEAETGENGQIPEPPRSEYDDSNLDYDPNADTGELPFSLGRPTPKQLLTNKMVLDEINAKVIAKMKMAKLMDKVKLVVSEDAPLTAELPVAREGMIEGFVIRGHGGVGHSLLWINANLGPERLEYVLAHELVGHLGIDIVLALNPGIRKQVDDLFRSEWEWAKANYNQEWRRIAEKHGAGYEEEKEWKEFRARYGAFPDYYQTWKQRKEGFGEAAAYKYLRSEWAARQLERVWKEQIVSGIPGRLLHYFRQLLNQLFAKIKNLIGRNGKPLDRKRFIDEAIKDIVAVLRQRGPSWEGTFEMQKAAMARAEMAGTRPTGRAFSVAPKRLADTWNNVPLYHGAKQWYPQLQTGMGDRAGGALYFHREPALAEQYGPRITTAKVNVKNVFDYHNPTHQKRLQAALKKEADWESWWTEEAKAGDWEILEKPSVIDMIKQQGFDSYIVNDHPGDALAVFNDESIVAQGKYRPGKETMLSAKPGQMDLFAAPIPEAPKAAEELAPEMKPPADKGAYILASEYRRKLYAPYAEGASSRTTPVEIDVPPVGSWRIDDKLNSLYGHPIDHLMEVKVSDVLAPELDREGRLDPVKRGDDERYAQWMKEGKQYPPVEITEMEDGRLSLVDGHRRLLAVKSLKKPTILAWVSHAVPAPSGAKDAVTGKPIMAGLTYEIANKKPWSEEKEAPEFLKQKTPTTKAIKKHHVAIYNGKEVVIEKPTSGEEFKSAAMRINDNAKEGVIRTPGGKYFHVSKSFRMARPITQEKAFEITGVATSEKAEPEKKLPWDRRTALAATDLFGQAVNPERQAIEQYKREKAEKEAAQARGAEDLPLFNDNEAERAAAAQMKLFSKAEQDKFLEEIGKQQIPELPADLENFDPDAPERIRATIQMQLPTAKEVLAKRSSYVFQDGSFLSRANSTELANNGGVRWRITYMNSKGLPAGHVYIDEAGAEIAIARDIAKARKAEAPQMSIAPAAPKPAQQRYLRLYHGGSEKIIGEKLVLGGRVAGQVTEENLGKGQDYGGIFFTPEPQFARTFAGHAPGGAGAVHSFLVDTRNIFDTTSQKDIKKLQAFVGKKYKNVDGDEETFTFQHFDFMAPKGEDGKRNVDWATMDPQVLEALGYDGAKIIENYGENEADRLFSYVLFKGGKDSPHWMMKEGETVEAAKKRLGLFEEPPRAGAVVSGLEVLDDIPNTSSISATFNEGEYEELPGIREIGLDQFNVTKPRDLYVTKDDIEWSEELAQRIKASGQIKPLIAVLDNEGYYILEGGHRLAALAVLGKKSLPALVIDARTEELPEGPAMSMAPATTPPVPGTEGMTANDLFDAINILDKQIRETAKLRYEPNNTPTVFRGKKTTIGKMNEARRLEKLQHLKDYREAVVGQLRRSVEELKRTNNIFLSGQAQAGEIGQAQIPGLPYQVQETGLYSNLEKVVSEAKMKAAPAAQWRKYLDPSSGRGTKADELKETGILKWLDEQAPGQTITKDELISAIKQKAIELKPIYKGPLAPGGQPKPEPRKPTYAKKLVWLERKTATGDTYYETKADDGLRYHIRSSGPNYWHLEEVNPGPEENAVIYTGTTLENTMTMAQRQVIQRAKAPTKLEWGDEKEIELSINFPHARRGDNMVKAVKAKKFDGTNILIYKDPYYGKFQTQYLEEDKAFDTMDAAKEYANEQNFYEFEKYYRIEPATGKSKWGKSDYVLRGGQNHTEILLTIPQEKIGLRYRTPVGHAYGDEADINQVLRLRVGEYLARRSPDSGLGSVLHIDEAQSDWHEAAVQKGGYFEPESAAQKTYAIPDITLQAYRPPTDRRPYGAWAFESNDGQHFVDIREGDGPGDAPDADFAREMAVEIFNEEERKMSARDRQEVSGRPEWAPWGKNWNDLAARLAIIKAATDEYPAVTWTTGETQAERYKLSNYVEKVAYDPKTKELAFVPKNQETYQTIGKMKDEAQIAEYVGKDVARRLIERENVYPNGNAYVLTENLKIGGEGMASFYDPEGKSSLNFARAMQRAAKALDPAAGQIETWEIEDDQGRKTKVWAIRITEPMKQAAELGLPMFSIETRKVQALPDQPKTTTQPAGSVPDSRLPWTGDAKPSPDYKNVVSEGGKLLDMVLAKTSELMPTEDMKERAKVEKMKDIIKAGEIDLPPIIVERDADGLYIVDGHHRWEAARQLGYDWVPVREYLPEDGWDLGMIAPSEADAIEIENMALPQFSVAGEGEAMKPMVNFHDDGSVTIYSPDSIRRSQWAKVNSYMKRLGYDWRGPDDAKRAISNFKSDLTGDHAEAIRYALGHGKYEKTDADRLTAKVTRYFGTTSDLREAGYINSKGSYLDFSGKKFGGSAGLRQMDHRDIGQADEEMPGGTAGMREFMAAGNIRMDYNSGTLDMVTAPNPQQRRALEQYISGKNGEIVIDLWEGLGDLNTSGYYERPLRVFEYEYPDGTPTSVIMADIDNFYAGKTIKKSDVLKWREAGEQFSLQPADAADLWAELPDVPGQHDVRYSLSEAEARMMGSQPIGQDEPEALDLLYKQNLEKMKGLKAKKKPEKLRALRQIKQEGTFLQKAVVPISDQLLNIAPDLRVSLRRYVRDKVRFRNEMRMMVIPFLQKKRAMNELDKASYDLAEKNGWDKEIERFNKKYGMEAEYAMKRAALDRIYTEAKRAGFDMGWQNVYAPRSTSDLEGFMQYIYGDADPVIREAVTEKEKAMREKADAKIKELEANYEKRLKEITEKTGARIAELQAKYMALLQQEPQAQQQMKAVDPGIKEKQKKAEEELQVSIAKERAALDERIKDMNDELQGRIQEQVSKQRPLTNEERWKLINSLIRGYNAAGLKIPKPGFTEARMVEFIGPELNIYYDHSDIALLKYIDGMTESIEMRKFFGQYAVLKDEQLDVPQSIGQVLDSLIEKGQLTRDAEARAKYLLNSYFSPTAMTNFWSTFRTIEYIETLGHIHSAITQLQDQAFAVGFAGPWNWLKAITSKNKVNVLKDFGIENLAVEFTEPTKLAKTMEKVFKLSGLASFDRFAKNNLINAAFYKYRSMANSPKQRKLLVTELTEYVGADLAEQTANEFKKGELTDNTMLAMFNVLLDFHPADPIELPPFYSTGGNLRTLYMLRQYPIKQLNNYRKQLFKMLKHKDPAVRKRAAGMLAAFIGGAIALGMTSDTIKDFLSGRPLRLGQTAVDNLLKLFGFTKYQIYQFRPQGEKLELAEALSHIVAPPFRIFESAIKDVARTVGAVQDGKAVKIADWDIWQSVPLAGKLYYWNIGGGLEKTEKTTVFKDLGGPSKEGTISWTVANGRATPGQMAIWNLYMEEQKDSVPGSMDGIIIGLRKMKNELNKEAKDNPAMKKKLQKSLDNIDHLIRHKQVELVKKWKAVK